MSKNKYTKYYKSPTEDTTVDTTDNASEVSVSKKGVVISCESLNVRPDTNTNAKPIAVLKKGTEVVVDDTKNPKWVHIVTESGLDGFCMKEYISIIG